VGSNDMMHDTRYTIRGYGVACAVVN